MELIDVLDENGNKTGDIVDRKEVHKKGLWHRIILVAIIDKNNKMLIQQRSGLKESNPNKWDISVAGHVSSGQNSIEAAIREVSEEVGIDLKENELEYMGMYKETKKVKENYIISHFYDCYIVKRDEIDINNLKIQEEEVSKIKLCDIEEIKGMIKSEKIVNRDNFYKIIFEKFE